MLDEKTKEAFKYLRVKNKVSLPFRVIVALGIIFLIGLFFYDADRWSWIESFINIVTLGVATIVFYVQTMETWENDLPKRLTVYFNHNNETVMKCEDAFLPGLTDIRALGQQIGLQMSDGEQLKFSPADIELIKMQPKKIAGNQVTGNGYMYVLPYVAKFDLIKRPKVLVEKNIGCRTWSAPYLNDKNEPNFHDE